MSLEADESSDRMALRRIVDAYAHHVDRREHAQTAALFTDDGALLIYDGQPNGQAPTRERHGRAQIERGMAGLDRYLATTHFIGQHTADLADAATTATSETYCLAHHISRTDSGGRTNYVMSIRYLDAFVKTEEGWRISERRLVLDWSETRPI
jgi:SnoaL-like domain